MPAIDAQAFVREAAQPEARAALHAWLAVETARLLGIGANDLDRDRPDDAGAIGATRGSGSLARDRPLTALGLDSLAAVELAAAIEAVTGVEVSLADLLSGASLAAVETAVLAALEAARRASTPAVESGPPLGVHPLSAGQEALWFSDRLAPGAAAYNLAAAVRIEGRFDPDVLGRALQALADRHPALRTTFSNHLGEPRQVVHRHLAPDYQVEGTARPEKDLPLSAEAYRPFDLDRGPLLRVRLWRLAAPEPGWLLLLAVHHLVTDLWSLGILVRDLAALYAAATGRGPAALAPLLIGYSDYVRWQQQALAGERGEILWDYWRQQLGGDLSVLALATDRPRPAVQSYAGRVHAQRLAPDLADSLHALSRASGVTLFVALLTGFEALLCRYTGQDEVVIGSPTAGRGLAAFREVMGYFVNPVALRLSGAGAAPDPTWAERLAAVQGVALAAFEHQALPFATVASRLRPERDPGRSPLFQTMFVFQKAERREERGLAELALGGGGARIPLADLTLVSVPLSERRALFDLSLLVADSDAGLPAALEVNRDLFDAATAERMLQHLATLLAAMAADPGGRVTAANLLSPAEILQLAAWNDTEADLPDGNCLPDLLAAQVALTPTREALIAGDERLTYRELARRTDRLARRLRALGVGPEIRVGVCARRSVALVAALLAVQQAGGAYLPLDPVLPASRLAWMLADSGAAVLLAEEGLAADLLAAGVPAGCRLALLGGAETADTAAAATTAGGGGGGDEHQPGARSGHHLQPENLAYLIYTSGSTGRPKGVAIEHRSAVTFVQWARRVFTDAELSGVLAATSVGFDLSVFEIFVPLCWGGRAILAESALALPGLPAAAEVRLVNTVPSVLAELLRDEEGPGLPAGVLAVNLAGEPLSGSLVRAVHRALPGARVLNLYGPTEDTTYSTWTAVPRERDGETPAIGRPIAHTRAHLFDSRLRQVPVGVPGEIHLGGRGLARGYHGRPDLTAERFVPDPLAAGMRLYRTGDLARRRPDGDLEILGRIDHQLKIHGVRVEPAEVAAALLSLPGLREAAVVSQVPRGTVAATDRRLVAYAVADAATEVDAATLREALRGLLPRAMVPQTIVLLPSLPLTPNGKVDRRALERLTPETPPAGGGREPAALRTPAEEVLAGIWAEVLGVDQVHAGDDFFDLGGHSLLALRVQARVRDRLGAELPLAAFFQFPTLAGQARRLAPGDPDRRRPLRRAPPEQTVFPLSFAQARLWLLERVTPGTAVYHMAGASRLTGPLDVAALARAFGQVVRRHDALRARCREIDGEPVQEIVPAAAAATGLLPLVCLARLDPARRASEAERLSREAARRPFDLEREASLRLLLVRLERRSHDLFVTLHHIAADEDSLTVLTRELATLYGAPPDASSASSPGAGRRQPPPLPPLPLRYVDYALGQREWLASGALERQLAWWRDHLAGLPAVELPADRPRQAARRSAGAVVTSVLSPSLADALAALCRREGVTLFMALLAAFQTVLAKSAGEVEVPVGSPASGRDREALLPMIGLFVNTLVLRSRPAAAAAAAGPEEPTFRGLLRRAREVTIQAHEHGDVPFELLVQALQPERGLGRHPFFDVVFALQRPPRPWRLGDLACEPRTVPTGTAKFDLTLFAVETPGALSFSLEHAAEIFDRTTAVRLLRHLEDFLAAALAEPWRPVADLSFHTPEERRQLTSSGSPPVSPQSLAAAVRERAERALAPGRRGRFAAARRRVEAAKRTAAQPPPPPLAACASALPAAAAANPGAEEEGTR